MPDWRPSAAWPFSRSSSSARWVSPEKAHPTGEEIRVTILSLHPQEANKMTISAAPRSPVDIEHAVVRFAGDSGDGMQLTGTEFTREAALHGNDLANSPDSPAEIRAPAGTTAGISGYQIQFAAHAVFSAGAQPDTLVAMNPAALKVHLPDLKRGGL